MEETAATIMELVFSKRRQGYKDAFCNFDVERVARLKEKDILKLMTNERIIRNKAKIQATITNAKAFIEIQEHFGSFDEYSWNFIDGKPMINKRKSLKDIPATSKESDAFSKDLKQRGFKFVGSTIMYAHMQAVGMVNDHLTSCFRYKKI